MGGLLNISAALMYRGQLGMNGIDVTDDEQIKSLSTGFYTVMAIPQGILPMNAQFGTLIVCKGSAHIVQFFVYNYDGLMWVRQKWDNWGGWNKFSFTA